MSEKNSNLKKKNESFTAKQCNVENVLRSQKNFDVIKWIWVVKEGERRK